jgi:hypothetical protein
MCPKKSNVLIAALTVGIVNSMLAPVVCAPQAEATSKQSRDPGIIRTFGSSEFRHNTLQPQLARGPLFSPNGDTIFVFGYESLIAFDTATGKRRFEYGERGRTLIVRNDGSDGLHVEFPRHNPNGEYFVLDYRTGKELTQTVKRKIGNQTLHRIFDNGRRGIALEKKTPIRREQREPRPDSGYLVAHLYDMTSEKLISTLGQMKEHTGAIVLSKNQERLAFIDNEM